MSNSKKRYPLPVPGPLAFMHHVYTSRITICGIAETIAEVSPSAHSDATGRVTVRIDGHSDDSALEALEGALAQMLADVVALRASRKGDK